MPIRTISAEVGPNPLSVFSPSPQKKSAVTLAGKFLTVHLKSNVAVLKSPHTSPLVEKECESWHCVYHYCACFSLLCILIRTGFKLYLSSYGEFSVKGESN